MEIQDIKQKLSLATVLQHYNLKPDKNQRLNCPFHADKSPSLQIYYKTQSCYCFSSNCKTHGKSLDVIDFIMHKETLTKHQALVKATQLINEMPAPKDTLQFSTIKQATQTNLSKTQILSSLFTYFKNAIHNSHPARTYLQSRNLNPLKLEVGYNTGQFHHGQRRDEQLIQNCVSVGLLYPWGVNNKRPELQAYKPFAKFGICFAMKDKGNHITGLYFRSTVNDNNAKHFYLKDSTGLYPHYPKPETEKLIICESIIDTASLLQIEAITKDYGLLAAYGTNRLTDEAKAAIKELPNLQEIIFAFDNDEAGNEAVTKYATELKLKHLHIKISKLELPCKDVNETLQAHNEDVFIHLLQNRTALFYPTKLDLLHQPITPINTSTPTNAPLTETPQHLLKTQHSTLNTKNSTLNTTNPHKLVFTTNTATYYIKGGVDKTMSKLNVTLEIQNTHLNDNINKRRFKLDLYDNKQLEKTIQETHEYLQLHKSQLETDLYQLTEHLDTYRETLLLEEANPLPSNEAAPYVLTTLEKNQALQLAQDPHLLYTITEQLSHTGIIGEDNNKTFLFVIAVSHIQENPLNALIQGSSGSGKTNLLKGIYKIIPEENKKIYSRCSEKMLYNVPKYYFKNKLVCFEDVDGLGEEAEYAWRELVSNGELISGVSYKDEKGNIGIKELIVHGPITSLACTTKGAIYADNMSRLFLIAIDESKTQTQKINDYQAKEASGQINKNDQLQAIKQLQNYVRILQPYTVHNPHAPYLKLPEGIRDERRLYRLYLYFIDMITVLHQYQRQKTEHGKLIATQHDCQLAKDLLFECIMLKMDELDGSLRQFFERLKDYIKTKNNDKYSFTQRELREALNISKTHLYRFITELYYLDYLQATKNNGNQGNSYQIRYWDDYKKVREDVKTFLQQQINNLSDGTQTPTKGTQKEHKGNDPIPAKPS